MSNEVFDLAVIGGGPGGYVAAIRAAQLGMKTVCIEKDSTLGGTCLNVGCIPSKALLDSSEHYYHALKKLQNHGVIVGDVKLDLSQMMKRKDQVVSQLTTGIKGLFKKNKITHIKGMAKLSDAKSDVKTISIQGEDATEVKAKKVLLATGSVPSSVPTLPFDGTNILSSTEALSLKSVPKHLVVVGAGFIGLELGSVWLRLGTKVTVIEFLDKILPAMDQQAAKELQKSLTKQGMEFHLSTKCLGASKKGNQTIVEVEDINSKEKTKIECDVVLVSTGRKPFTDGLGLEDVGVKKDERGFVQINDHFETNVSGVYAVGDIVRGPMLAHKAEEEGIAAVEIMSGLAGHVNYNVIPGVVYTWPELASVGKSEEQLKTEGREIKVGKFPFMANARAKAMDEVEGFVKVIADSKTDEVLGVHIIGPRASDMIAEAATIMEFKGSAEDIARTCHSHPTLSEVLKEAALAVDKRQINM